MKTQKKVFIILGTCIVLIALGAVVFGMSHSRATTENDKIKKDSSATDNSSNSVATDSSIDPDNPPQFIQADFVELDKVYSISKFRSGMGHDFSANSGETCRSMKHYFTSIDPNQPDYKQEGGGDKNAFPMPTVDKDVKIFSPVDGTLVTAPSDGVAYDNELDVVPDAYPSITIRLMHVQNVPGVSDGKVTAGQLIGLVLANQSFDLAIQAERKGAFKTGFISYFAALPESIFAKYKARGVVSREDLITTKEYRDAHPFGCHDKEVFDENYGSDDLAGNVVFLSGYDQVNAAVKAKYNK